jgi:hypothetical protein
MEKATIQQYSKSFQQHQKAQVRRPLIIPTAFLEKFLSITHLLA